MYVYKFDWLFNDSNVPFNIHCKCSDRDKEDSGHSKMSLAKLWRIFCGAMQGRSQTSFHIVFTSLWRCQRRCAVFAKPLYYRKGEKPRLPPGYVPGAMETFRGKHFQNIVGLWNFFHYIGSNVYLSNCQLQLSILMRFIAVFFQVESVYTVPPFCFSQSVFRHK